MMNSLVTIKFAQNGIDCFVQLPDYEVIENRVIEYKQSSQKRMNKICVFIFITAVILAVGIMSLLVR